MFLYQYLVIASDSVAKLLRRFGRVRLVFICAWWLHFSGSFGPTAYVAIRILRVVRKDVVIIACRPLPELFA